MDPKTNMQSKQESCLNGCVQQSMQNSLMLHMLFLSSIDFYSCHQGENRGNLKGWFTKNERKKSKDILKNVDNQKVLVTICFHCKSYTGL